MFRRSIRIVLASFALLAVAAPTAAFADSARGDEVAQDGDGKGKGKKDVFPMAADAFKQKVEARIAKARQHLVDHMAKKGVDEAKQKDNLAKFDEAAKQVREAADNACADGTVTKEEAKSVRDLAKKLHHKAKGKKAEKGNKGKGKGKGKKDKGASDA